MTAERYIVALDQGTTSSRALVYNLSGREIHSGSAELKVRFPKDGWVEQDAAEIWQSQLAALKSATAKIDPAQIVCIGISNQRETTIAWDKLSGEPLAPAIVWQCRRSADICEKLKTERVGSAELSRFVPEETGLVIDAYFSATKIRWMLENVSGLSARVRQQQVVFGTVDSWLLYQLSKFGGEPVFATDSSNASRTMLYSLKDLRWSPELLAHFGLDESSLCEVKPSNAEFCRTKILGPEIPVTAVLGDQQAALFGQGCIKSGETKCTFGTGAFMLSNTGPKIIKSESGMLSTVAWTLARDGKTDTEYALEGSIFVAGSLVQWLRDKLQLISSAAESESIAAEVADSAGVTVVPAFVGLGAPHWRDDVRGVISGLTRDSSKAHIVRAALESVAHQLADLLGSPEFSAVKVLRIDGGMSVNAVFCGILADYTGLEVEVSGATEATARGAATMAAIGAGVFKDAADAQSKWSLPCAKRYCPQMSARQRDSDRERWQLAIKRLLAKH